MISKLDILNQYDNYGLRRLLETAGRKSFSALDAKRFRKWAHSESLKNTRHGNVDIWLKNMTGEYIK